MKIPLKIAFLAARILKLNVIFHSNFPLSTTASISQLG